MAEEMDVKEVTQWIADYHKLILADLQKETMWFYPTANLVSEASKIITTITAMKANTLKALGPTQVKFSGSTLSPAQPTSKDTVWVTVKTTSTAFVSAVVLHHRGVGYFKETPMFDDGKHHDGAANDGVWGVSVPPGLHRRFEYFISAQTANAIAFELRGATANGAYLVMLGLRPDDVPLPQLGVRLRIEGPLLTTLNIPADASGSASVPMTVPNDPQLDGFHLTLQALAIKDQVIVASNGLEVRFCK